MRKLIENKGIRTDKYFVPPFDLYEGEIIVIHLYNGAHFYNAEEHLVNIFTGKTPDTNVEIHTPLTFVPRFWQSNFRRLFWRITVGEYLRKHALKSSPFAEKIYENTFITKHKNIDTLAGTPRKLLSLYSVLSKTDLIIFDVAGIDATGAKEVHKIVKDVVDKGGAAIMLDGFEDMKNDCTKYIQIEFPGTIA